MAANGGDGPPLGMFVGSASMPLTTRKFGYSDFRVEL
jgi:hypothetical protein